MEESTLKLSGETESEQISEQESKEILRAQHFAKRTELPRHQNKMVAEITKDMYLKGLMCE